MERLTNYEIIAGHHHAYVDCDADYALQRLAAYEDTGRTPEEIKEMLDWSFGLFSEKIGDFLQAKSEDRLIVLPCKVGDTVYLPDCSPVLVTQIQIGYYSKDVWVGILVGDKYPISRSYAFSDFGKTVFLTREEAEKHAQEKSNYYPKRGAKTRGADDGTTD